MTLRVLGTISVLVLVLASACGNSEVTIPPRVDDNGNDNDNGNGNGNDNNQNNSNTSNNNNNNNNNQTVGPPTAPTLTGTAPVSPSNNETPTVLGTTDPDVTLTLYRDALCTTVIGSGTSMSDGSFSVVITVTEDSTTDIYADATLDGATSDCEGPLVYVEDSTAPAAPTVDATAPVGPANQNAPEILGTAEADATVALYSDSACANTTGETGAADGDGDYRIPVSVEDDSTSTFYATATDAAGNTSSCSTTFVTYTEDSTLPQVPTFTGVVPTSPANENSPVLSGTADAGATIFVFSDSTCTTEVDTTLVDSSGVFSMTMSVPDDTTSTFFALAAESSGQRSACSAGIEYVEDSTPPTPPTVAALNPAGPSSANDPDTTGTAEANASVEFFSDASCTASLGSGAADGSGDFTITVTVPADTTTTIYGVATDAAGNVSACTDTGVTYVEDSTPPGPPVFTGTLPASPANDNAPVLQGTGEAGATVRIYNDVCITEVANTTVDGAGVFSVAVAVLDNSVTDFYAAQVDVAGNPSSCSSAISYEEVSPVDLMLDFPPDGSLTNEDTITVRGSWPAASNVDFVRVNGVDATSSDGFLTWQATLTGLSLGETPLTLTAQTDGSTAVGPISGGRLIYQPIIQEIYRVAVDSDDGRLVLLASNNTTSFTSTGLWTQDIATGELQYLAGGDGSPSVSLGGATGIDVDSANDTAYVTIDTAITTDSILAVDLNSGAVSTLATLGFCNPEDVALDGSGTAYVVCDSDPELKSVALSDGTVTDVATGLCQGLSSPAAIAYDPTDSDRLLAINQSSDQIFEFSISGGTCSVLTDIDYFSVFMRDLVVDEVSGTAYIVENDTVYELDPDSPSNFPPSKISGSYRGANGIALDPTTRTVYIADEGIPGDQGNPQVSFFDAAEASPTQSFLSDPALGSGLPLLRPADIDIDRPNNRAFVVTSINSRVYSLDLDTRDRTVIARRGDGNGSTSSANFFGTPQGVVYEPASDRLWFSTRYHELRLIELSDSSRTYCGPSFTSELFFEHVGLALDVSRGRILQPYPNRTFSVSGTSSQILGRPLPTPPDTACTGSVIVSNTSGPPDYDVPVGIALDTARDRILTMNSDTQELISTAADDSNRISLTTGLNDGRGLTYDATNDRVLIADYGDSSLQGYDIAGDVLATLSKDGFGQVGDGPSLRRPLKAVLLTDTIALVISEDWNAILAVDLVTGQRVIWAR